MTAAAKLGRDPNTMAQLPGEGTTTLDFLKANGKALGVPDSVDDYKLTVNIELPDGLPIDEDMLTGFQKASFEAGIPPEVAQVGLDFYAQHISTWFTEQRSTVMQSEENLTGKLKQKFGGNWEQERDKGARAFQVIAADMGLDAAATKNIATKLNDGMGDVHLVMFTNHLAGLLSEDQLVSPSGGAPRADLATAQQRKAQIMERGTGEMAKARGNAAKQKQLQAELKGLNEIIQRLSSS